MIPGIDRVGTIGRQTGYYPETPIEFRLVCFSRRSPLDCLFVATA